MARVLNLVLVILVVVFGLAFHIRNDGQVALDYYVGVLEAPTSWVLAGTLGIGILLGFTALLPTVLRLRRQLRKLNRNHETVARELASLRAIPIKDVT